MKIQDFFTIAKFFALTVFMSIGVYSYFKGMKYAELVLRTMFLLYNKNNYSLHYNAN